MAVVMAVDGNGVMRCDAMPCYEDGVGRRVGRAEVGWDCISSTMGGMGLAIVIVG